jgi:hypothetical protein
MQEGSSLKAVRLTQLHVGKNYKKIVLKLFEQTTYLMEGEIRGHMHGGNRK